MPDILNSDTPIERSDGTPVLESPSRQFKLFFQGDGNLVLSRFERSSMPQALWDSHTNGTDAKTLVMQGDGNLVIRDSSDDPLWNSKTNGHDHAFLQIQDDGNLVIYSSDRSEHFWDTNNERNKVGFWQSVVNSVNDAADFITDALNTVGNAIADAIEIIGSAIDDACNFLADHIHIGFISSALRWFGNLVSDAFEMIAGIVKSSFNLLGSLISGAIKIAAGIITFNLDEIKEGFSEIVDSIVAFVVLNFINIIQFGQTALIIPNLAGVKLKRPLSKIEKELLRTVFRKSLSLNNIRIHEGSNGLLSIGSGTFTIGNTIYFNNDLMLPTGENFSTFVHECTHVWQYQIQGINYIGNSIRSRTLDGDTETRDWRNFVINEGIEEWSKLNVEAQAEVIGDIFFQGKLIQTGIPEPVGFPPRTGSNLIGEGVFFQEDGINKIGDMNFSPPDFTKFARNSLSFIRSQVNPGLSIFL